MGYTLYANGDAIIWVHDPDDGFDGPVPYRLVSRGGYLSLVIPGSPNRVVFVVAESPVPDVPTISEWGLIVTVFLLLTGIAIKFARWRGSTRAT